MTRRSRPETRSLAAAAIIALAAIALAPGSASALPDALGLVPRNAEMVVLVTNPAAFSGKIAQLKEALGLPAPFMDDVLGLFKDQTGMLQGVDDNRPMLLVIQGLSSFVASNGDTEPLPTILVPVRDYAAFVGNYSGDAAAPVTALDMPHGSDGYAKRLGQYAAMSPEEEIVQAYTPSGAVAAIAERIGKEGAGCMDRSDLVVYVDLEALGPVVAPKLDELVGQMSKGPAGAMPGMEEIWAGYANLAKGFLTQGSTLLIGLDLAPEGMGLSKVVRFRPDSTWAEAMQGGRGAAQQQLGRLPDQSFIVAGAFDFRFLPIERIYGTFFSMMPESIRGSYEKIREQIEPMFEEMQGGAMMLRPPPPDAMMGGGLINALYAYDVKDADRFMGVVKEYFTGLNGFAVPIMAPGMTAGEGEELPAMTYSTSITENALTVAGVPVNQFTMSVSMPPEMMQQMGPAAGFMSMLTNYQGYMAATGSTFVMTTVADPELIGQALRAAASSNGLGSGGAIAAIRDRALPPGSIAEFYLSLGGIAEAANGFLGMMGQPPIEVPSGLPPVASGVSLAAGEISYRLYVPTETSKFAVDTAMGIAASIAAASAGGPGAAMPPPVE